MPTGVHIKGVYHAPASSHSQNIILDVIEDNIVVNNAEDQQLLCTLPLSSIKLTPAIGSIPREFSLKDGAKIVIPAGQNLSKLTKYERKTHKTLHYLEQHRALWLAALILIPICLYAITYYVIPGAAKSVVNWLPEPVKHQIDDQSMLILEQSLLSSSKLSLDVKAKISRQWNELLPTLHNNHQNYKLLFRASDGLGANAFALPGGTIVVTDELINLLKDSPDAILAVLLHEMGHVENNHGLQLMTESIATSIMLTYFLGELNDLAELVSGTAMTLVQRSFSRDLERQADEFSKEILIALGKSPQSLGLALTRISQQSEVDNNLINEYLSSHPLLEERLKNALYTKPESALEH